MAPDKPKTVGKAYDDHPQMDYMNNIYTTVCPAVRGDNPRALASGLSYTQVNNHGMTVSYHLHQCRPCTSRGIWCKNGKRGIIINIKEPHQTGRGVYKVEIV